MNDLKFKFAFNCNLVQIVPLYYLQIWANLGYYKQFKHIIMNKIKYRIQLSDQRV